MINVVCSAVCCSMINVVPHVPTWANVKLVQFSRKVPSTVEVKGQQDAFRASGLDKGFRCT